MADDDEDTSNVITLADGDGAVVIYGDGTFRMVLPHTEDGANLTLNHTLMVGFALGLGLQDQRMIDVLTDLLEEKRLAVEAKQGK
jgi:hypothetical protein